MEISHSFEIGFHIGILFYDLKITKVKGLPCGSDGKASACNAVDPGSIPGSE